MGICWFCLLINNDILKESSWFDVNTEDNVFRWFILVLSASYGDCYKVGGFSELTSVWHKSEATYLVRLGFWEPWLFVAACHCVRTKCTCLLTMRPNFYLRSALAARCGILAGERWFIRRWHSVTRNTVNRRKSTNANVHWMLSQSGKFKVLLQKAK